MPRGDRTGPMGMGPRTGRAAGFCSGSGTPGYANPAPGRGFGMGGGRGGGGRGWRNMYYATGQPGWMRFGSFGAPYRSPDPEVEKQALKNQADALHSELNLIKKRLDEIETGNAGK
jgi:hypothetical protein